MDSLIHQNGLHLFVIYDNGQDSYWRTVRKRCPDCIADYYEEDDERSYEDTRSYEDERSYNNDDNNNRENRPRRHLTHSSSYHLTCVHQQNNTTNNKH